MGKAYIAWARIVVGWMYFDLSDNRVSSFSMHSESNLRFSSAIIEDVLYKRQNQLVLERVMEDLLIVANAEIEVWGKQFALACSKVL